MKIAITGGIGSGKTYISKLLSKNGIEVYDCDEAAKRLMSTSHDLQEKLSSLIGKKIYQDGHLNKKVISDYILVSEQNKQKINDIVHPAVADDYLVSGKEWMESAILFESGFNHRIHFDNIICVVAPNEIRVKRIAQRDKISTEKARQWIACQFSQERMAEQSDFVITNDGVSNIEKQIEKILQIINKKRTI